MISVGIVGILASLAIPAFEGYRTRVRAAEAYTHLGAMVTGVKAYYQQEHWVQGMTTSGAAAHSTQCRPQTGTTSNWPTTGQKSVLDWQAEDASFRAIGFTPPEPLLFHYRMGPDNGATVFGAGVYWSGDGGDCGTAAGGTGVYNMEAAISPNGSTYEFIRWRLCSNANNELFICEKVASQICAVSFGRTPGAGTPGWMLLLIGLCLWGRRSKRTC